MSDKTKQKIKGAVTGSWKTTVAGGLIALGFILPAIAAWLDEDPNTIPNWGTALWSAAGALGLGAAARDSDKSSESSGAE